MAGPRASFSLDVAAAAALPVAGLGHLAGLQPGVDHLSVGAHQRGLLRLGGGALLAGLAPLEVEVGTVGAQPVACAAQKQGEGAKSPVAEALSGTDKGVVGKAASLCAHCAGRCWL